MSSPSSTVSGDGESAAEHSSNAPSIGTLRVAVTGGSGMIGREVVRQLAERGHRVMNIDRRAPQAKIKSPARFCYADLSKREQVQPLLEQVDAVCHLGEIPNPHVSAYASEEIYFTNTRIGSTVMQTAADLGLRRLIYTSSCQAYGLWERDRVPPLRLPFDETHPLQPRNVYALSKAANESFARYIAELRGLSVAIFRFPSVMSEQASDDWLFWMTRHGGGKIDGFSTFVHVTDLARAYVLAVENPRPGCEAYHFSATEVLATNMPLRERLIQDYPEYPRLPEDWPAFKSPMLLGKAREHLGWEPAWNFLDQYRKRYGREPQAAA